MKISLFSLWIFAAVLAGCKENPRTKQIIRLPGGMLALARKLSLLAVSSRNKLSASLRSTAYAARNVHGKVVGQVTNY